MMVTESTTVNSDTLTALCGRLFHALRMSYVATNMLNFHKLIIRRILWRVCFQGSAALEFFNHGLLKQISSQSVMLSIKRY